MKKNLSVVLVVLILATFFVRGGSFEKKHPLTFDEIVYPNLAVQLTQTPPTYNTIAIYNDSVKKGKPLPEYFKKPLFKHPPMFPWLISMGYQITSKIDFLAGFWVSLIAGTLLIALAYFLGQTLFDSRTAVFAAILMAIEPVTWICSQKIWMETTLAFFCVLSLYLFALYIKKNKAFLMIASGVACGCAVLTKYPGILVFVSILVYTLISQRRLFKDKIFLLSLLIPFLMLIPWIHWNISVYGLGFLEGSKEVAHLFRIGGRLIQNYGVVLGVVCVVGAVAWFFREKIAQMVSFAGNKNKALPWGVVGLILVAFVWVVNVQMRNAFNPAHLPVTGWTIGMFAGEAWHFYVGRLIELSPFYIFALLAVFLFIADKEKNKDYALLWMYTGLILGFYILWGNYQCRYITAVTVPLMILSARCQLYIYDSVTGRVPEKYKYMAQTALLLVAVYCLVKTLRIDYMLAIPNNICYF